VSFDVVGA